MMKWPLGRLLTHGSQSQGRCSVLAVRAVAVRPPPFVAPLRPLATGSGRGRELAAKTRQRRATRTAAEPSTAAVVAASAEDPWVEVKDKESGLVYYWNQSTNETTALGDPKPTGDHAPVQQQSGGQPGLGDTLKQGVAIGAGVGIAHAVIGSIWPF